MFKQRSNLPLIIFYVLSIGSVVFLFNIVTGYAQKNLKVPSKLGSTYDIDSQALSQCLKESKLLLKIKQSGLYLNAYLIPSSLEKNFSTDETRPNLSGHFNKTIVSLKGHSSLFKNCPGSDPHGKITINANTEQKQLKGVLASGNISLPFTSQSKNPEKTSPQANH